MKVILTSKEPSLSSAGSNILLTDNVQELGGSKIVSVSVSSFNESAKIILTMDDYEDLKQIFDKS